MAVGSRARVVIRSGVVLVMIISAGSAACSLLTSLDDLSADPASDSGTDSSTTIDADGAPPTQNDGAAVVDGGGGLPDVLLVDASCPVRYMPAEGTYAYTAVNAADVMKIGDGSVATEPYKNPFFATVRHKSSHCWTWTTYLANGPGGRHDHAWTFCNVCNEAQTETRSLDLVEERDYFVTAALPVGAQESVYACGSPNAMIIPDAAIDAAIAQTGCTGLSTGAQPLTVQVTPISYAYKGQAVQPFAKADASARCEIYHREVLLQVAGGGAPTTNVNAWFFDVDSGIPMLAYLGSRTVTQFGGATVDFQFNLITVRNTPDVTPLLPLDDAGL